MADKVVAPAANPADDVGGIVTTVRTESTSDLDVTNRLKAEQEEYEASPEGIKAKEAKVKEEIKEEVKEEADDDDDKVDFKSLSPKQQKAVSKLYKERRQEKREFRDMQTKIDDLEAKIAGKGGEPAPVAEQITKPVKPRAIDFKDEKAFDAAEDEYEEKMYKYRRALERAEEEETQRQRADAKTVNDFNVAALKFAETHPDYEEVMDSDVPTSNLMFGAIVDEGPALGYYFATHPEDSAKIAAMPQKQAVKAITRIIVKLEDEAGATPPPPKVKKKEEPPEPVKGGTAPAKDVSKMTFKEREREFAKTHPGALNYTP